MTNEPVKTKCSYAKGKTRAEIKKQSCELRNEAIKMFESGMSNEEISEKLGMSIRTIRDWRIRVWDKSLPLEKGKKITSDSYMSEFNKEWTRAVNRIRKFCGLPLFK